MRIDIYDLECMSNLFTYTGKDKDDGTVYQFTLFKDAGQLDDLYNHLMTLDGQVGFNNINYDAQLIEEIIKKYESLKEMLPEEVTTHLYDFSQKLIHIDKENGERPPYYKFTIRQLDLYKIHHFDNKAKTQSLKGLEFHMRFENLQDMPFKHDHFFTSLEEVQKVLDYNLNDVIATELFYKKSIEKIELRKSLSRRYGLDLMNDSNASLGSKIVLDLYCKKTGKDKKEVQKSRTYRSFIPLSRVIFPYIKFHSQEFKGLLDYFRNLTISENKESFAKSVTYKGFTYDYGIGGIHGCAERGVYDSTESRIIKDADVTSLYPSIAIENNLYPEHLGEEFSEVYGEDIVKVRMKEKAKGKQGDKAIIEGFKEASNCVYGKSNSKWSYLYDMRYMLATTTNGQLLLSMLAERLVDEIPSLKMLQANTDGITVSILREDEGRYNDICARWQLLTNLKLEFKDYKKFVINDVNNYIAIPYEGDIKKKGLFETNKELHKDDSFRIIPIALEKYFVEGISIEDTIRNSDNIYDFCGWFRARGEWEVYSENIYTGEKTPLPKSNRYYAARNGELFKKKSLKEEIDEKTGRPKKNKIIFVDQCKGQLIKFFNKYYESPDYDINYKFYIDCCNQIIKQIERPVKDNQKLLW